MRALMRDFNQRYINDNNNNNIYIYIHIYVYIYIKYIQPWLLNHGNDTLQKMKQKKHNKVKINLW